MRAQIINIMDVGLIIIRCLMNYCQYTRYELLIPTSYTACCTLMLTPPALGGAAWICSTVNIKPERLLTLLLPGM